MDMNLGPIIGGAIGAIAAVLVAFFVQRDFNKKTLMQKQMEEARKEIFNKLNSFYGPLQRLRGKSKMLTDVFKNGKEFRTLVELLDGKEYIGNDGELLEEIIKIGEKCDELILSKSGLIDNDELRVLLDQLSTHYTLIRLAKEKKLKGDIIRFEDHVFPSEVDEKINAEVLRLNNKLEQIDNEVLRLKGNKNRRSLSS